MRRPVNTFTGSGIKVGRYAKHTSERGIHTRGPKRSTTDLEVECWCRTEIVLVDQDTVLRCGTASCGRAVCHAPGGDAA